MSRDEHSSVLVDQNMNMVGMRSATDRHNYKQDGLIQSDRVGEHVIQQGISKEHVQDLTSTLKSPLANGTSDILQSQDVGMQEKTIDRCQLGLMTAKGDCKTSTSQEEEQSEDEAEDSHVCESEADERHDQRVLDTDPRRVCLVKVYAWIKEEMSRTSARSVASHLFQHERTLLSRADHESILHCTWRREAVEQLLKKVLMGPCDIYEVFIRALKEQEETHIATKLVNSHASKREIELFTTLERASLQQCLRPDHHLPRFCITNSDHETLLYYFNNKNTIDSIGDHFMSRFIFSIREHTNICQCSLDRECRVTLLLETLKKCSDCVFKDLCEILSNIEMEHVIKKLERRKQGEITCRQRQKRRVDTSQGDASEEPSTSTSAKRQCVDSSKLIEHRLVSSMQRSSSTLNLHTMDQFGFDVENVNKGSIVIQLCPKKEDSWSRLEENCWSGRIKDFIPLIYNNESIQDLLQEGEYKLQFTIYTLPKPPDSQGDQKVMFHLETEPEKPKEPQQDPENPIEDHIDLLCEELEISRDLLTLLKEEGLVGADIKQEIDKHGGRAKKIKFLLKEVGKHGKKGYDILKDFIKDDNEDLYKELSTRDDVKVIDSKMDVAAKVNKRSKSATNHRGVFKKEVFFTGTVVLKVEKKGSSPVKENVNPLTSQELFEISCPEIIDPVCHFKTDKSKSKGQGEVTMVLEEAWSAVGDKPKPQREILIGKRKKGSKDSSGQGSCKRADSEEARHEEKGEQDKGKGEETDTTEDPDLKTDKDDTAVAEAEQPRKAKKDTSKRKADT